MIMQQTETDSVEEKMMAAADLTHNRFVERQRENMDVRDVSRLLSGFYDGASVFFRQNNCWDFVNAQANIGRDFENMVKSHTKTTSLSATPVLLPEKITQGDKKRKFNC